VSLVWCLATLAALLALLSIVMYRARSAEGNAHAITEAVGLPSSQASARHVMEIVAALRAVADTIVTRPPSDTVSADYRYALWRVLRTAADDIVDARYTKKEGAP
jgi:hypothetical protein